MAEGFGQRQQITWESPDERCMFVICAACLPGLAMRGGAVRTVPRTSAVGCFKMAKPRAELNLGSLDVPSRQGPRCELDMH
jgi:hypothetical protein